MITKKKLKDQLDNMNRELIHKDTQINALLWGLCNPNFAKLDTSHFYNLFNSTNSIATSYLDTGTIKTSNPSHSLIITYLDVNKCLLPEKRLIEVRDAYIEKYELLSYDLRSGVVEIRFTIKNSTSHSHYKYVGSLYELSSKEPMLFVLDVHNDNWIKLPVVSCKTETSSHIIL